MALTTKQLARTSGPIRLDAAIKIDLLFSEMFRHGEAAVGAGLIDAAEKTTAIAKSLTPRLTGHNARSVGWAAALKSPYGPLKRAQDTNSSGMVKHSDFEVSVASSSGYGGYLEIGTSKMEARPYIVPAAQNREISVAAINAVKREMNKGREKGNFQTIEDIKARL